MKARCHKNIEPFFVLFADEIYGSTTEVIRPDEDTVLKTAAGKTVVGSSPTASAGRLSVMKVILAGCCQLSGSVSTREVVGERCDSLRSHCSFVLRMKLGPNKRKRKIDK